MPARACHTGRTAGTLFVTYVVAAAGLLELGIDVGAPIAGIGVAAVNPRVTESWLPGLRLLLPFVARGI